MSITAINLAQIAAPDAVEIVDFEAILGQIKADFLMRVPALAAALDLESEPVAKLLQTSAYRETVLRAHINDTARAVMLPTATGADLDNLVALFGVARLVVTPADPTAVPPVIAVMESDADLRRRYLLALDGFSTAGSRGAYLYHALSASGAVLDASVISPTPGQVLVTVLGRDGTGVPDAATLEAVTARLNDERVRPLCDSVTVAPAVIQPFAVTAALTMFAGPDPEVTRAAAEAAVAAYAAEAHRLGRAIRLSAIYRALHQPGVEAVTLTSPAADIEGDPGTAPHCTAITVTIAEDAP